MVNASWDIVIAGLIVSLLVDSEYSVTDIYLQAVYWVETKGKTLEEIDAIFEGEKHSDVPDVEAVRLGKAQIDVGAVEREIEVEAGSDKLKDQ